MTPQAAAIWERRETLSAMILSSHRRVSETSEAVNVPWRVPPKPAEARFVVMLLEVWVAHTQPEKSALLRQLEPRPTGLAEGGQSRRSGAALDWGRSASMRRTLATPSDIPDQRTDSLGGISTDSAIGPECLTALDLDQAARAVRAVPMRGISTKRTERVGRAGISSISCS